MNKRMYKHICIGIFTKEANGDKSVAYIFNNPHTGIIFEKNLMPLLDAVGIYIFTYIYIYMYI
jgi:hypothetical protein